MAFVEAEYPAAGGPPRVFVPPHDNGTLVEKINIDEPPSKFQIEEAPAKLQNIEPEVIEELGYRPSSRPSDHEETVQRKAAFEVDQNLMNQATCDSERPAHVLHSISADSASMQGRRPTQEDRHVKIPDLARAATALQMPIDHLEKPCALFAVYDGHQGQLCADYAAKGLHLRILKKLSAVRNKNHWTDERICLVLKEVFVELDTDFLAKHRTSPDGCTAVAVLIIGNRLFVAWAGDSRAVLCRRASGGDVLTVPLTQDHRPGLKSEAERVERAGGQIVNFDGALRVAHVGYDEKVREIRRARSQGLGTIAKEPVALAVSRSLGDREFKAVTGKELLVSTPSVRTVRLNRSCKFIALMCDGISDVMTNEEVVFELNFERKLDDASANARAVCGSLVQEAYRRGSGDNLTVVFVSLEWASESMAQNGICMELPNKKSRLAR